MSKGTIDAQVRALHASQPIVTRLKYAFLRTKALSLNYRVDLKHMSTAGFAKLVRVLVVHFPVIITRRVSRQAEKGASTNVSGQHRHELMRMFDLLGKLTNTDEN